LNLDAGKQDSYPRSGTTWRDVSGNGRNTTLTNGPAFNSENNGSIVFDGIDDYGNITSTVTLGNQFTIIANVKLSGSNADTSIYGSAANAEDNWFGILNDKVSALVTETGDVNNFFLAGTTTLDTTNTVWYNLACTVNISTLKLYVNGTEEASTTRPYIIGSWSSTGMVGRRATVSQRYFKGHIANIFMYNRVLTSQEILQNFNALRGRYGI
jgi:hypothetical protein